jgi:GDP-4-dehydro-6-deoxy-D-mannose reductase
VHRSPRPQNNTFRDARQAGTAAHKRYGMKYLITGFSGFVSRHFLDFLENQGQQASVLGIDMRTPDFSLSQYANIQCLHKDNLENAICRFQPDFILHLASYSSVAYSWMNPVTSFANNTNIFLNLLESVRLNAIHCRILSVGSSEEYGNVRPSDLPLTESSPVEPINPYAVARVSQELLSKIYSAGYNLDIIITRSFNHIGPGQRDIFVVSSFARQLAALAKKNKKQGQLRTGDTAIVRDFIDVRDVVRAYDLLFKKGRGGEIYNVCSGRGIAISEIIDSMAGILKIDITSAPDPSLIRPTDNKMLIGSNEKIKQHTGWESTISLKKSLEDILDYWMQRQD